MSRKQCNPAPPKGVPKPPPPPPPPRGIRMCDSMILKEIHKDIQIILDILKKGEIK